MPNFKMKILAWVSEFTGGGGRRNLAFSIDFTLGSATAVSVIQLLNCL